MASFHMGERHRSRFQRGAGLAPRWRADLSSVSGSSRRPAPGYRARGAPGKTLAAALLFVGLAGTAVRPVSVALLPLAVFVYLAARREEADAPFLLIRFLAAKREELGRRGLLPVQAVAISPEATVRSLAERLVPGRYCVFWVVDGDGKVLGVVSEAQVLDCFFSGVVHRRAGALVSRAKPSRDGRG